MVFKGPDSLNTSANSSRGLSFRTWAFSDGVVVAVKLGVGRGN